MLEDVGLSLNLVKIFVQHRSVSCSVPAKQYPAHFNLPSFLSHLFPPRKIKKIIINNKNEQKTNKKISQANNMRSQTNKQTNNCQTHKQHRNVLSSLDICVTVKTIPFQFFVKVSFPCSAKNRQENKFELKLRLKSL